MGPSLERPEFATVAAALLLAAVVAFAVRFFKRNDKRWTLLGARFASFAVLALLVGVPLRSVKGESSRPVVFVVDGSSRLVPSRRAAQSVIRDAAAALAPDAPCGVLVSGSPPQWVYGPAASARALAANGFEFPEGLGDAPPGGVALALRAAAAVAGSGGTLVALIDGWTDSEGVAAAGRTLRAAGLRVYVHPLAPTPRSGTLLESVTAPQVVRDGDQAVVRIAMHNSSDRASRVAISCDVVRDTPGPARPDSVKARCPPGRSVAEHSVRLGGTGNAWIHVRLESVDDAPPQFPEQCEAWAAVQVTQMPSVLLVEGQAGASEFVREALLHSGRPGVADALVPVVSPADVPHRAAELTRHGAVVLIDVPASSLAPDQLEALREYVSRTGGGLVAFGGEQAFDLGGYAGSKLEELLPVDSADVHPDRASLGYALLFVIDVSGSMAGRLSDSKLACLALMEAVPDGSVVGVVAFAGDGTVLRPLARLAAAAERVEAVDAVTKLAGNGGTSVRAGIEAASSLVDAYSPAPGSGLVTGHVIVISDGEFDTGESDFDAQVRRLRDRGWCVHTIGVGGVAEGNLRRLAAAGHGQYSLYPSIPRLGPDDGSTRLMFNLRAAPGEPVFRLADAERDVLAGVADFNRTRALKAGAALSLAFDVRDSSAGLVVGRLGAGRTAACLFAAQPHWSRGLLESPNRLRLLTQPILYALRTTGEGVHVAALVHRPGVGWELSVDTSEDAAPELETELGTGGASAVTGSPVRLRRERPQKYAVMLPERDVPEGPLALRVKERDSRTGGRIGPVSIPLVARESVDLSRLVRAAPNQSAIDEFLERSGGQLLAREDVALVATSPPSGGRSPWWNAWAAAAVIALFAADIHVRSRSPWRIGVFYAVAAALCILALHVG